ncbi:hypothetical protein GF378_01680, partial [Candidatus Pacearchaeota archaeon]|nr:hypothetical protein [Candidatus Pacearchaeota archaeon]
MGEGKPMNKDEALKALTDLKEVLDKNKIPFWLEYGTLLGAIRDKGFIPWDDDIDLGSFKGYFKKESVRKKLSKQLEEKGFLVYFFDDMIDIERKEIIINIE